MGIVVCVNGLVTTSTGYTSSVYTAYWRTANYLRELMGWEEFPWHEPAGEGGLDTSMGAYNLLLEVAFGADSTNPPHKLDGGVICQCKSTVFPQLWDRDLNWNIYVPFNLPGPVVFGEFGYTFSVGSAVRYGQELEKLTPYIREDFVKQVFGEAHTDYYLSLLTDKLEILKEGVSDSLRLNLPLQVKW